MESGTMLTTKLLLSICAIGLVAGQNCPTGWAEFSGQCYLLTDEDTTELPWLDAYAACLAEGADLASINSQAEQDFIEAQAEAGGYTDALWIGLNKYGDYNAELEWTDGSDVSYTNWEEDQPNNDNLELCSYTLAIPNDNCFDTQQNINVVEGLMYCPWDANPPNTFNFGYYYTYDYPQWCEDECAREKDCHAWTYFSPSYYSPSYCFQSYCVGRSDYQDVRAPDWDTWSGFKKACGEVGLWSTANCGLRKGYVCKKAVGSPSDPLTMPPTQPITGFCPEGWLDAGNKCFLIEVDDNQNGHSWEEALSYCRGLSVSGLRDLDLATIANTDESDLVTANIQKRSFGFWIGLHELDDWAWTENVAAEFFNWGPGEPNGGGVDNCAEIWVVPGPSGTWNDINCNDKRGVVCQGYKDGTIQQPAPTTPHSCPVGYTPYWYSCYKLVQTPGTWVQGEQACSMEQAHLVSIHSEPENVFVRSLARAKSSLPIWIGWRQGADDDFRWTDGWPNDKYSRWAHDEPDEGGEGCVAMNTDGEWYNGMCNAAHNYVCKTTDQPRPTTPPLGDGSCPRDWELYMDYCYYFGTTYDYPDYDKFDWATAIQKCKERAGGEFQALATLASIHSYAENNYIRTTLERIKDEDYVWDLTSAWIGLSKKEWGADYLWTDGTPTDFLQWAPGEPNDKDGTENCVEMILPNFGGMWNDHSCSEPRYFVCKAPMGAPATTPTMPPIVPGNCPSSEWEEYGADCYLIRPDDYETWDAAHGVCVTETRDFPHRANIASVLSSAENFWLHHRLVDKSQMPMRRAAWIGLYRFDTASEWRWFDGSTVGYTNWNVGQPNDDLCVEILTEEADQGYWGDNDCTQLRGFVCKVQKDTSFYRYVVQEDNAPKSKEQVDDVVVAPHPELFAQSGKSALNENIAMKEEHHGVQKDEETDVEAVVVGILVGLGVVCGLALSVYFAVVNRKKKKVAPAQEVEMAKIEA